MDMTQSVEPRSDQWNADDLIAGPFTVTISDVIAGAAEQPFDFKLVESERVYRPSKTSRRVIIAAWGTDTKVYAGRRLTLYREPSIMFGGQKVGGIRISHMSDIDGPVEVMAQTTRGKREKFVVLPIASNPTTKGGDPTDVGAAAGLEGLPPLRSAINAAIRAMQANDESAFLRTWCQAHGIPTPSSAAIEEKFGERARDLPALMAEMPTDVPS